MSTTIHSRPITPEYAKGWERTFGRASREKRLAQIPDLEPIIDRIQDNRSTNG
jgi:hypothetical protein